MQLNNVEIAKALFNHKKSAILSIIKNNPKTVKEIAEELGEKVSRLYYHINQLEELGLIVVKNVEMVGNLAQKYYISNNLFDGEFTFNKENAAENKEFIMNQLYAYSNDALSKIKNDLESEELQKNSEASVLTINLPIDGWKDLNNKIRNLMQEAVVETSEGEVYPYKYMLMSYREDK